MIESVTMSQLERLLNVMRRLRDPQHGCEWDRQQTFSSLAPYTLEETYEVLDAIARQDMPDLREELGDLLLQVVFYAQIAKEQGAFDFQDICAAISDKLERRHPFIFASEKVERRMGDWERSKAAERAIKAQFSLLDDIPHNLPALMRAHKIQKRCASVGFDWTGVLEVVVKVREELDEVLFELQQPVLDQGKVEEEAGDLLFAVVNLVRHLGGKSEMVLQQANRKFERRFRRVEERVATQGLTVDQASAAQLEAAWRQVKQEE